jgi:hypothetical protein
MNRFDLEDQIMKCWNTKDDVSLLAESILDSNLDADEISNALIGIAQLHELRCKKLFDTFEYLISKGLINAEEEEFTFADNEL